MNTVLSGGWAALRKGALSIVPRKNGRYNDKKNGGLSCPLLLYNSVDMKITVIMPAYNVEDTVIRCLDSIAEQTYPIHELLIVEDHSTDSTLTKINEWIGRHGEMHITLIAHEENRGLGEVRFEASNIAEGDYLYFVDSDDYLHPDAIRYLVENADGGDIITGGVDGKPTYGFKRLKAYFDGGKFINNRIIKKSLFEKAPHSKLRVLSDADTLPRLLYYAEKTTYAPLSLYYYNKNNPKSITNSSGELKRTIYRTLISLHNYYFFLENEREWLFKFPFQGVVLSLLVKLYTSALENVEEFNKYDKETTEIFNLIYDRLTEIKKENGEQ